MEKKQDRAKRAGKKRGTRERDAVSRKRPGTVKPVRKAVTHTMTGKKKPAAMVRLNRYIAGTGLCSRREADNLIRAGLITVNGKVITSLGTKVSPGTAVKCNGKLLRQEKKVYILLNKPRDYVTTSYDPHARKKVTDLVQHACTERVYPVGRLDRMTTGVLLLTNDGELTTRLTHPAYNRKKVYHIHLDKQLKKADMDRIVSGITLEDGEVYADAISYVDPADKKQVGLEIHSGRNRIVRRIFEHLGYRIVRLDRVYFAGLTKKGLTRGEWRFLKDKEIAMLKTGKFL